MCIQFAYLISEMLRLPLHVLVCVKLASVMPCAVPFTTSESNSAAQPGADDASQLQMVSRLVKTRWAAHCRLIRALGVALRTAAAAVPLAAAVEELAGSYVEDMPLKRAVAGAVLVVPCVDLLASLAGRYHMGNP